MFWYSYFSICFSFSLFVRHLFKLLRFRCLSQRYTINDNNNNNKLLKNLFTNLTNLFSIRIRTKFIIFINFYVILMFWLSYSKTFKVFYRFFNELNGFVKTSIKMLRYGDIVEHFLSEFVLI